MVLPVDHFAVPLVNEVDTLLFQFLRGVRDEDVRIEVDIRFVAGLYDVGMKTVIAGRPKDVILQLIDVTGMVNTLQVDVSLGVLPPKDDGRFVGDGRRDTGHLLQHSTHRLQLLKDQDVEFRLGSASQTFVGRASLLHEGFPPSLEEMLPALVSVLADLDLSDIGSLAFASSSAASLALIILGIFRRLVDDVFLDESDATLRVLIEQSFVLENHTGVLVQVHLVLGELVQALALEVFRGRVRALEDGLDVIGRIPGPDDLVDRLVIPLLAGEGDVDQ